MHLLKLNPGIPQNIFRLDPFVGFISRIVRSPIHRQQLLSFQIRKFVKYLQLFNQIRMRYMTFLNHGDEILADPTAIGNILIRKISFLSKLNHLFSRVQI